MDNMLGWSRRSVLAAGLAVSSSWLVGRSQAQNPESVMTRPIPHSGEELAIVGLGTAVSFPSADESQRAALKDVIDALVAGGGKLIDTASVYGNAETVIGDIVRASNVRNKIFIATKIEVRSAKAGADEFQRSLQRLQTEKVDLLQLHNVSRASQSLSQLREWKAAGRCRYVGITSTYGADYSDHPAGEAGFCPGRLFDGQSCRREAHHSSGSRCGSRGANRAALRQNVIVPGG